MKKVAGFSRALPPKNPREKSPVPRRRRFFSTSDLNFPKFHIFWAWNLIFWLWIALAWSQDSTLSDNVQQAFFPFLWNLWEINQYCYLTPRRVEFGTFSQLLMSSDVQNDHGCPHNQYDSKAWSIFNIRTDFDASAFKIKQLRDSWLKQVLTPSWNARFLTRPCPPMG